MLVCNFSGFLFSWIFISIHFSLLWVLHSNLNIFLFLFCMLGFVFESQGNYVGAAMRMWKIRNVEEFLELGRSLHIYTLNITYADSSGNIAYHMTGAGLLLLSLLIFLVRWASSIVHPYFVGVLY